MSSEQVGMSLFAPLSSLTAEARATGKNSGFQRRSTSIELESGKTEECIKIAPPCNHDKNRRFISSTSNIPANSQLSIVKTDLSHNLLAAGNISSKNFVDLQSYSAISINNSCINMHKNEQLNDFDMDIRMTHKDNHLTNNSINFSSYQPSTIMDAKISNSFPIHMYRGELSILEKYRYDLSRAQLKASSRTSALLAGFAMVALVELQYERTTPPFLLITLGVVTTLLVSVHLLALMMSTCILPYIEANGCTQDSPHIRLKFYIDLSWLFSTCIGLVLFLIEIGIIFFVKFYAVNYITAAYITTAMLIPVVVVFTIFSCLIHKNRFIHSINRVGSKAIDLQKFLNENNAAVGSCIPNTTTATSIERHLVGAGLHESEVLGIAPVKFLTVQRFFFLSLDQKFTQSQKYWLDIIAYITMFLKLNYILVNNKINLKANFSRTKKNIRHEREKNLKVEK
uniref:Protein orai n=2 Tax=Wuchereria bancrofti TaxID=6293 RepID=A0A1I8ENP7_WUCBA